MTKVYKILLIVACIFSLYETSFAGFALGGTTITQTGTDSDLSGLALIPGVTTFTTGAGGNTRTIYNIGNLRLQVNGTLTISPEIEAVYAGTGSPRSVFLFSGTSNTTINGEIVENGIPRYSEYLFMWSPYQNGSCCNNFGIEIQSGADFNWNGGKMRMGSSLRFRSGANITINGGILQQDTNSDNQLRMETSNLITNGFTFRGNDITFIAIPSALNNYQPQGTRGALGFSSATPNIDFPIRNYTTNGSNTDIRMWQGNRPILTNSETGTRLNLVPHISGNGSSRGVVIVQQEVNFSVIDNEGNSIENARVFTRDTNNGNREVYNQEGHLVDASADKTYFATTSSTGSTGEYTIITGYNISNTGNGDGVNSGNYAWDYRGNNNDDSDMFDFHVWSYNYNYNRVAGELKGAQVKQLRSVVTRDLDISELDQSVVDLYTQVNNLGELYDVIKNWKTKNANLESPNIETLPVKVVSDTLEILSDYDVILDPLAGQIFSLDSGNQNMTIRTSTLACGSEIDNLILQGNGSLILQNSASISCPYVDANADSLVSIITPLANQNVRIYNSLSDMNTNSSPIATLTSGIDSKIVYRYNSGPGSIFIKAFVEPGIDKGSMKSYVLNPGNDNVLDMGSGGDFTSVELILRQIKGTGFSSATHSLKASYNTGTVVTESDKNDIAARVKLKVEEDGGLLKSVYDILLEILTRVVSIKQDTQTL